MTDHPRAAIMRLANEAIATHGGPTVARVFFKFTCRQCGTRCTFDEPNLLWAEGECASCGLKQPVTQAGFMLAMQL